MMPGRLSAIVSAVLLVALAVPAHAATIEITMENLEVSPKDASAKVGDTIEWINKDVFAHTATAGNGDFDVNLPTKKSGMLVLKKAARVVFYGLYHPNMKPTLKTEP